MPRGKLNTRVYVQIFRVKIPHCECCISVYKITSTHFHMTYNMNKRTVFYSPLHLQILFIPSIYPVLVLKKIDSFLQTLTSSLMWYPRRYCSGEYRYSNHAATLWNTEYKSRPFGIVTFFGWLNTLKTGSFKLFKRPFPGFLTILTL